MNRTYQKSSFIKYLVWVLYVYPRVAPKFFRWRAVTSGKSLKSSYRLSLYRGASKDKAMVMDTGPQCTDLESQTAAWCFLILIWRLEIRLGKTKQFACTFQPSGGRAWPGIHIKLPMWPCIMSQWRKDCHGASGSALWLLLLVQDVRDGSEAFPSSSMVWGLTYRFYPRNRLYY